MIAKVLVFKDQKNQGSSCESAVNFYINDIDLVVNLTVF